MFMAGDVDGDMFEAKVVGGSVDSLSRRRFGFWLMTASISLCYYDNLMSTYASYLAGREHHN
jgi:hypothetical protein